MAANQPKLQQLNQQLQAACFELGLARCGTVQYDARKLACATSSGGKGTGQRKCHVHSSHLALLCACWLCACWRVVMSLAGTLIFPWRYLLDMQASCLPLSASSPASPACWPPGMCSGWRSTGGRWAGNT